MGAKRDACKTLGGREGPEAGRARGPDSGPGLPRSWVPRAWSSPLTSQDAALDGVGRACSCHRGPGTCHETCEWPFIIWSLVRPQLPWGDSALTWPSTWRNLTICSPSDCFIRAAAAFGLRHLPDPVGPGGISGLAILPHAHDGGLPMSSRRSPLTSTPGRPSSLWPRGPCRAARRRVRARRWRWPGLAWESGPPRTGGRTRGGGWRHARCRGCPRRCPRARGCRPGPAGPRCA